jgi:spermidine dehydrogenase
LGLAEAFCPGSYHDTVGLCDPVSMGGYRCPRSPDEPMVLQLYRTPLAPGLPAVEQWKKGMRELLITKFDAANNAMADASFSEAHRAIREVLGE